MRRLGPVVVVGLGMLVGLGVEAAPERSPSARVKSRVYQGKPTVRRGTLEKAIPKLPSHAERTGALAEAGDPSAAALPEIAWASLTVKHPNADGRAALVFMQPDAVDARLGIAIFSGSPDTATEVPPEFAKLIELMCKKVGCPGSGGGNPVVPSRTMQVWVKADDDKKYSVVCRAKFGDKVGDLVVTTDGGFTLTQHVDHTGKSYGTVGFMIDPTSSGWYGFTVFSPEPWSTSGCTVDELS